MKIIRECDEPRAFRPFCQVCGWRMGGDDSWNGAACKCGHSAPPIVWIRTLPCGCRTDGTMCETHAPTVIGVDTRTEP